MPPIAWFAFLAAVCALLALDLGVLNKRGSTPTVKSALKWTSLYVALAGAFSILVYYLYEGRFVEAGGAEGLLSGKQAALQFITGYLVEESLSADNIFVIAVIFGYFRVPVEYQHRVLFWGILGAIVLRGIMIAIGAALVATFSWITYVFGTILILTAIRLLRSGEDDFDPESNFLARLMRRFYPVSAQFDGQKFFTTLGGRRAMTPLFITLLVVESSDVLFAVDSIPAIFAITTDPFLVFTSNIFAILGLRSLYFALAGLVEKFRYLKTALVFLLGFIGVKMLIAHHYEISTGVSLSVVAGILAAGVAASLLSGKGHRAE